MLVHRRRREVRIGQRRAHEDEVRIAEAAAPREAGGVAGAEEERDAPERAAHPVAARARREARQVERHRIGAGTGPEQLA